MSLFGKLLKGPVQNADCGKTELAAPAVKDVLADNYVHRIDSKLIHVDPSLQPKHDAEWDRLADLALNGSLPLYFAAVPLILCVPFDLDYRPDLHPVGKRAIELGREAAKRNEFQNWIVYPRGKWFIVSDHYIELFAALEGRPDFVPCFIMGKPDSSMIADLQGPIAVSDVRKVLFG